MSTGPFGRPYGTTRDEERSYAGSLKAFGEFFKIAYRTPELRKILLKVLKMRSLFAIATKSLSTRYTYQASHFKRHPELKLVGENMLYSCPVQLSVYNTPSLFIRFFVTDPLPPIQTSAGIYGLVASFPTKANKRMVIRILEAKRGPGTTL